MKSTHCEQVKLSQLFITHNESQNTSWSNLMKQISEFSCLIRNLNSEKWRFSKVRSCSAWFLFLVKQCYKNSTHFFTFFRPLQFVTPVFIESCWKWVPSHSLSSKRRCGSSLFCAEFNYCWENFATSDQNNVFWMILEKQEEHLFAKRDWTLKDMWRLTLTKVKTTIFGNYHSNFGTFHNLMTSKVFRIIK